MIFAKKDHIKQIIAGTKTQTRRVKKYNSFIYRIGITYGIRPSRTAKNIPDGRIKILERWIESVSDTVTKTNALAEGGYTIYEYEILFDSMYKNWGLRTAYLFKFIPVLCARVCERESVCV